MPMSIAIVLGPTESTALALCPLSGTKALAEIKDYSQKRKSRYTEERAPSLAHA
jgi:hypothetical protein